MIVVVGEALVDVVVSPEGATAASPGGSPLNVAVGLARLGEPTGLVTRIGPDDHGDLVRAHLEASGVELLGEAEARRTGVAAAHLTSSGEAGYDFTIEWDLPPTPLPDQAGALHFGSLGAMLRPGAPNVLAIARAAAETGLPVSYDPNIRPTITPDAASAWDDVHRDAGLADLVRMSADDAAFLRPDHSARDVADQLLDTGARVVVVTSGHGPTLAFSTTDEVSVDAPEPEGGVADTVGAGDSFMAALIATTLSERRSDPGAWSPDARTLERHLRAAQAAARVTVGRPGADPPWRHELGPDWP